MLIEMNEKEKKQEAIICATCGKEYSNMFSNSNQAYGCASELIEKQGELFSLSHYGSCYDTMKHIFKKNGDFKLGIICDKCIEKAIAEGIAIEDENYNYFSNQF